MGELSLIHSFEGFGMESFRLSTDMTTRAQLQMLL